MLVLVLLKVIMSFFDNLNIASGMLKYGRGSKHSSQQPLDDVCRDLHCERERYTWTSHPALEGTMCGNGMVSIIVRYVNNDVSMARFHFLVV